MNGGWYQKFLVGKTAFLRFSSLSFLSCMFWVVKSYSSISLNIEIFTKLSIAEYVLRVYYTKGTGMFRPYVLGSA